MITRIALALVAFQTLLLAQALPTCHPVSGDKITGRDLAMAVPELHSLAPELVVGYSPNPGAARTFQPSQLRQLAKSYHLQAGLILSPVCFAWPTRTLSKEELINAIKKTLAGRRADVSITDQSRIPVPTGDLTLPLRGLTADSSKPTIWNGYVSYAGDRKFNTWVQVLITVHEQRFVAARSIRAGEPIDAAAIKEVQYSGPMQRVSAVAVEKNIIGQCARGPISAGTAFTQAMLYPPLDVARDEMVTVLISCGGAHIQTQGVAAEAGYIGNIIRVRNTKTGRVFRGRIDERGVVTVVAGGSIGLVAEDGKS